VAADKSISMFTPRRDPVELKQTSPGSASLHWPGEPSSWGVDCQMEFTLSEPGAIDIVFTATPTRDRFGAGYEAFMWASYLACAIDRKIHFYGVDGEREGWVEFGADLGNRFETGTVAFWGVAPLPFETGSQTLNIVEHPTKHFLKPFYYGLMDGDHDLGTTNDTLAYVMMFDQETPIRFAMWNFVTDAEGQADPHRPAWDWQFVIRDPVPFRKYRYRARLIVCPFSSREDVLSRYETWAATPDKTSPGMDRSLPR
jgi:hypothetical protein